MARLVLMLLVAASQLSLSQQSPFLPPDDMETGIVQEVMENMLEKAEEALEQLTKSSFEHDSINAEDLVDDLQDLMEEPQDDQDEDVDEDDGPTVDSDVVEDLFDFDEEGPIVDSDVLDGLLESGEDSTEEDLAESVQEGLENLGEAMEEMSEAFLVGDA